MKPEQQNIAIALSLGYLNPRYSEFGAFLISTNEREDGTYWGTMGLPDYTRDLSAMYSAMNEKIKPFTKMRVKFINTLRDIVGESMPKNKAGTPIVSDVDLLFASSAQLAEAYLKTLNLWTD